MKDRHQNIGNAGQWVFEKIAERLGQEPMEVETARGHESHFKQTNPANPDDLRWLSFRPDEGSAEYSTLGLEVQITMRGILPPRPTKDGVIFESADGRARGLVLNNGHAAFEVFPFPPSESLGSSVSGSSVQNDEEPDSASGAVPGGLQSEIGASGEPSATAQPAGQEKQQKVKWTGYIASEPLFGTSKDGSPRVNLIVSEHLEDDKTVYHRVYSTKKEAKRLQDAAIAKGQRVRVEGYKQDRERQNRDGTKTSEERVYAVHVSIYKRDGESETGSPSASA